MKPQILQVTFSYPTSLHYCMEQFSKHHKYIQCLIFRRLPNSIFKSPHNVTKQNNISLQQKNPYSSKIFFWIQNMHQNNFSTFPLAIWIKVTAIHVTSQFSDLEEEPRSSDRDKVALSSTTKNLARMNFSNTTEQLRTDTNSSTWEQESNNSKCMTSALPLDSSLQE